jgi:2-hydroxychromene-2-carboxylate isomerase
VAARYRRTPREQPRDAWTFELDRHACTEPPQENEMSRTVEFYFDFGSPTTYLAWTQLPKLCAEAGATLVYKPILLGGIFQATGNSSPATIPAKARYMGADLSRFARRYGVPFAFNPHFPINTMTLMRIATGLLANRPGDFDLFVRTVFAAMWVDAMDLGNSDVLTQTLAEAGLDAAALLTTASDPKVKDALKAATGEAIERGAFGAPTMFVGEQMFFGQDRLDFVKEALLEGR